jgi:hypothetical protein
MIYLYDYNIDRIAKMQDVINTMNKMYNSPQFKKIHKCSHEHCKIYETLLDQEKQLAKDIDTLYKAIQKTRDIKQVMPKFAILYDKLAELTMLKQDKKALLCVIDKCKEEYIDMVTNEHNEMAKVYNTYKKQMVKITNKMSKKEKHKK